MNNLLAQIFEKQLKIFFLLACLIWAVTTFGIWKKYDWNPSSMVGFGKEFAFKNWEETPKNAILFQGREGDLGAGYDGQIFYYYSRTITRGDSNWPNGFDESYRAPRIGYPLLISIFGFFGPWGSIFGMYFWNVFLFFLSFFALRELLSPENKALSFLYLFNPFSLNSYAVLVSDSIVASLVILSIWAFHKQKWLMFLFLGNILMITKEPAVFFIFPLGLRALYYRRFNHAILILSTLGAFLIWQIYLAQKFPNWRAGRLMDFIIPMEGIGKYLANFWTDFSRETISSRELVKSGSRFPLVLFFVLSFVTLILGNWKKGVEWKLAYALSLLLIAMAGYFYYWSVYDNVSRMFLYTTLAIILAKNSDSKLRIDILGLSLFAILLLYLFRVLIFSRALEFQLS